MKLKLLTALFIFFNFCSDVFADQFTIVEKLNQEEKTWHKYFLFTTAESIRDPKEYIAALDWFKNRLLSMEMPESRYALTYSMMLWRSGIPNSIDTALAFAIVGYTALQLESARCENRLESIQVARLWYDVVRPQIHALPNLSLEKRKELLAFSNRYLARYESVPMKDATKPSLWLCYNMPSYIKKIGLLPDAVIEKTGSSGIFTHIFVSHPTVHPEFASQDAYETRRRSIVDEMSEIVTGSKSGQ